MSKVELNVPNINCGHCEHTVTMELSELSGVTNVDASSVNKTVVVEFDSPATEEQIRDLLVEINYAPV